MISDAAIAELRRGAVYIRDARRRIVWHERWPAEFRERGFWGVTTSLTEGSSSHGLRPGDVVFVGEVAIWDESARRRLNELTEAVFE